MTCLRSWLQVVMALLICAGCGSNNVQPAATTSADSGGTGAAYPGTDEALTNGYPPRELATGIGPLTPPPAPLEAPQPAAGLASVSGLLFAPNSVGPIMGTDFFLMPAIGEAAAEMPTVVEAPDPATGDVVGRSDLNGHFVLTDIPPGNYFLMVWAPYGWRWAQTGADSEDPLLITLVPEERLALGVVFIPWP